MADSSTWTQFFILIQKQPPDVFYKKSPATLLKRRLWHRCFPVNFVKFLLGDCFYLSPTLFRVELFKIISRNNCIMIATIDLLWNCWLTKIRQGDSRVNIKLSFMNWIFFYNLVILKWCKIPCKNLDKALLFLRNKDFVWKTDNFEKLQLL